MNNIFKAIANDRRRQILEFAMGREVPFWAIVDHLGIKGSSVHQHITILMESQLMTSTKMGISAFYTTNPEKIRLVLLWFRQFKREKQ